MSGHTPAPWHVEAPKKLDGKHYAAGDCFKVWPNMSPPGGWTIASIAAQSPNHEANARLIAAAPNLLEAAQLLEAAENERQDCEECQDQGEPEACGTCFPKFDDARIKRRAAIAKAEGRAP